MEPTIEQRSSIEATWSPDIVAEVPEAAPAEPLLSVEVLAVVSVSVPVVEPLELAVVSVLADGVVLVLAEVSDPVVEPLALAVVSLLADGVVVELAVVSELADVSVPVDGVVLVLAVVSVLADGVVVELESVEVLAVVSVPLADEAEPVEPMAVVSVVPPALACMFWQSDFTCACCSAEREAQLVLISSSDLKVMVASSEKKASAIAPSQPVGMVPMDEPAAPLASVLDPVVEDCARAVAPRLSERAVAASNLVIISNSPGWVGASFEAGRFRTGVVPPCSKKTQKKNRPAPKEPTLAYNELQAAMVPSPKAAAGTFLGGGG